LYLTSFCPPSALVVWMLFTPLLYGVVSAGKIAGVGLEPSLLAVLLPARPACTVLAHLLPVTYSSVRSEIAAAIDTPLLLPMCRFHPCILKTGPTTRKDSGQLQGYCRGMIRWGQTDYLSWGSFGYPLQGYRTLSRCLIVPYRASGEAGFE
jgi:hypothetical protein